MVDGFRMCAGTRAPLPVLPPGEATAVRRLRGAGAVIVATTNLVEIAFGISGQNPWTGDVRNPRDARRQPGGSSSGSAVAVATGIGLSSVGTDTGGSLRIPAALCGVTTIKPSYGAVPVDGMLALSPTCDHVGPLTTSVADAAYVLDVLMGSIPRPLEPVAPGRIGVPRRFLAGRLGASVRSAYEELLARLAAIPGLVLVDVAPADVELADEAYLKVVRPEAAHVHRAALETSPQSFSPRVRDGLLLGRTMSAGDYLDGRRMRRLVSAGLDATSRASTRCSCPQPRFPRRCSVRPGRSRVRYAKPSGRVPAADAAVQSGRSPRGVGLPIAEIDGLPIGVQVVTTRGPTAAPSRHALAGGASRRRRVGNRRIGAGRAAAAADNEVTVSVSISVGIPAILTTPISSGEWTSRPRVPDVQRICPGACPLPSPRLHRHVRPDEPVRRRRCDNADRDRAVQRMARVLPGHRRAVETPVVAGYRGHILMVLPLVGR